MTGQGEAACNNEITASVPVINHENENFKSYQEVLESAACLGTGCSQVQPNQILT